MGTLALCGLFSATAFADDLGSIERIADTVTPNGENGRIVSLVQATTDEAGRLALPQYEDAVLEQITASTGTLQGQPQPVSEGQNTYLVAQFAENGAAVELRLEWAQEGTYELGKAKTKDTAPGGLKCVTYSMVNTTPLEVGDYSADVAVPEGWELEAIVDYDAEEDFATYSENGVKFARQGFGSLPIGGEGKIKVNVSQQAPWFAIAMWAVTLVVSGWFLYVNRSMLAKAKELAAKKKAEKEIAKK